MANANVGDEFRPFLPVPPGATLGAELRAREIPQGTFACWIGREQKDLTRIIRGGEPLTPALARDLERALDIPASFWLNYEGAYRAELGHASRVKAGGAPMRVPRSAAGAHKLLRFSLAEIERIPESTHGVYAFWHEDSGTCVYIGRAEDLPLKERLKQHWRGSRDGELSLWLDAVGDRMSVRYIPAAGRDKIAQIQQELVRLWKPASTQQPKGD